MKPLNPKKSLFSKIILALVHPVVVFIMLQIVWLAIIILWIIWFVNQNETISQLANDLGAKNISPTIGVVFLTAGCILLGIILAGVVVLFAFAQKQRSRISQQGTFVSSVTHELRSPLASLQLSFETLQTADLPEEIRMNIFHMVERDIDRLSSLVDRILISSRLDRGIVDFDSEKELINVKNLLEDIIDQARYLDRNIQNRVKLHCDETIEIVEIRLAMVLILGNLLENAIKYSPPGAPIEILVEIRGNLIVFVVEDQGFGISHKDLKRIFRMFERGAVATKKAIKGTGLGLYIVKSSVNLLGGQIWAESDGIGQGAKFTIKLPLHL